LLQMQARSAVIYEELDVLPEVLVIGCGTEGAAVALAVSENQPVTVIDHDTPHDSLSLLKGKTRSIFGLSAGQELIKAPGLHTSSPASIAS
jgi:hypothetical protein